jgi:hypothetical protein
MTSMKSNVTANIRVVPLAPPVPLSKYDHVIFVTRLGLCLREHNIAVAGVFKRVCVLLVFWSETSDAVQASSTDVG